MELEPEPEPDGEPSAEPSGPVDRGTWMGHVPHLPYEPPEAPAPREVVRRLDPRYVTAARLSNGIALLALVMLGGISLAVLALALSWEPFVAGGAGVAFLFLVLVLAVLSFGWPSLAYRRTTWQLSADGFRIRRGVLWRHEITVPRARIQHTDVSQGPLQRRFDLATLVVHTAGMHFAEVELSGLSHATALEARDALLDGASDEPATGHA